MYYYDMHRLLWSQIADQDDFHVARLTQGPRNTVQAHRHDYFEVFWIEAGTCQHLVNDGRQHLQPGQMVFIRPNDVHTYRCSEPFTFVNVAFRADVIEELAQRYAGEDKSPPPTAWPWACADPLPTTISLGPGTQQQLSNLAAKLTSHAGDPLQRDRFILWLVGLSANSLDREATSESPSMPIWLSQALSQLDDEDLREGVPALARKAQRTREHTGRVLHAALGRTSSQEINRRRLERAAHLLRMSNRTIADVGSHVGLPNPSHFHRLFRARFGMTPRKYREQQFNIIGYDRG